jgi:AraC family transcriptional regulator
MANSIADIERKKRIDQVIDYILAHPAENTSLQTLAGVASYSAFHLQKIFKQTVGESPKQYMLKLRLETAFHLLIIHPQKTIQEIAIDCNFSSVPAFTRAVKGYFGHAPGELRALSHRQQMMILHTVNQVSAPCQASNQAEIPDTRSEPDIHTIKLTSRKGLYILAPFDDHAAIRKAFSQLARFASGNDWPAHQLYGILTPHQRNSYRAFLPLPCTGAVSAERFAQTEIPGGKFAVLTVKGDLKQTNKVLHYFYQRWLADNDYKIAGVAGFETFSEHPAEIPYYRLERKIHIPIEPAV